MIYLDHAATTPLDREVLAAMRPWLDDSSGFANPASDHAAGRAARAAVEQARGEVAALIGASPDEIVWTSGATEANNLALKGALEFRGLPGAHLVTARSEHKSVVDSARWLETRGVRVTWLKPGAQGRVDAAAVLAALAPDTALVSLMWVNNETGVVNDVEALAPALRERGVLFHVDAVQALGRLPIDLERTPIDLLSLSAHKCGGPKGVGALFVRRRPRARLAPQLHGGGHEWGMRSGTVATHQVVGMGAACARVAPAREAAAAAAAGLRAALHDRLAVLPALTVNAHPLFQVPQILNVSFAGAEGEALRALLPGLMVSSGAACSSATREPSYVLRALGHDDELAASSLRFSFGRATTSAEVEQAGDQVVAAVLRLRGIAAGDEVDALDLPNVYGYSGPVWRHFTAARHTGRLAGRDLVDFSAGSPAARVRLRLQLRVSGKWVREARFQAYGCPVTIAVGEWLAARAAGLPLTELRGLRAAAVAEALEIPVDKTHCALMAEDLFRPATAANMPA